jgi:predicted NUDIX family NTP pyrophosphohydrolase
MGVLDGVRIVLYRCHEKGLEILLVNNDISKDADVWRLPNVSNLDSQKDRFIELDDIVDSDGNAIKAMAIEADWHDIPSIRGMIKYDVKLVKDKIKTVIPDLEKSTYFTVKEAFKKVLPQEYAALKELKDIILDRNICTNI